jgi:TonB family protein
MRLGTVLLIFALEPLLAAQVRPLRIRADLFLPADVKPPIVTHRTEPSLSTYARAYRVQGDVVLLATINKDGRANGISVLSGGGYGLDENAIACVQNWEFMPAMKDGQAVAAEIPIIVKFRLPPQRSAPPISSSDERRERQRSEFNVALWIIRRNGPALDRAIATVKEFAQKKVPSAVYLVGLWESGLMEGAPESVVPNEKAGIAKIQQAAKANYGPALYWLARRGLGKQAEGGEEWDEMRQAAMLGSAEAQYVLGQRHEKGAGTELDAGRAENYYRLCASRGVGLCQYRLGRMLFDTPHRTEGDYEQAMAWFALAADQDIDGAHEIYDRERLHFTLPQETIIDKLKRQFVGKFD